MGQMTWYEDYYAGSSDYPICHESAEAVYLNEEHTEPPEATSVELLRESLEGLTEKQRFVLELSWGLRGGESLSFYEIGEYMGVGHRSVADIYGRAMNRIRGLIVGRS